MTDSARGSTSRKTFIAAAGLMGAAIAVPASAQTPTPAPEPPKAPPAAATPTAAPTPSASARDLAQRMRSYDPSLSDAQIENIAKQIDDNNKFARTIRKSYPLHNGDEPSPEFEVGA